MKLILILILLLTLGFSGSANAPTKALAYCSTIEGFRPSRPVANRGTRIGIHSKVNNCSNSGQRMYYQITFTSKCGQHVTIATSSASRYRGGQGKIVYAEWDIPKILPSLLHGQQFCSGLGTLKMTVYHKNFWELSHAMARTTSWVVLK
jgi:hypothetical protein